MARTMFELEERMADMRREMDTEAEALLSMAGDAGAKMEDVRAKQTRVAELKERLGLLENEHTQMENAARARMQKKNDEQGAGMDKHEAAGLFYRGVLNGNMQTVPKMAYEQLGVKPAASADQGAGSKFLPSVLSNEILMEPQVTNPLRARMTVTNIPGLRMPKIGFALDDSSYVAKDGATAKELKLSGDTVEFGRHELPLKASVSESLLRSTPLNIEAAVNAGLQGAQAAKELAVIFAAEPSTGEEGMSLYAKNASSKYLVKAVEGVDLLDAVLAAASDLEDAYQANACVVMRRQDYFSFIRTLTGSDNLFGRKPEDVIGYPVIFCEKATIPVVGDLSYLHLNYDGEPYADTDKDVTKRLRFFTLNAEYDIKVKLYSAFRLATIKAASTGTTPTSVTK